MITEKYTYKCDICDKSVEMDTPCLPDYWQKVSVRIDGGADWVSLVGELCVECSILKEMPESKKKVFLQGVKKMFKKQNWGL